MRPCQLCVHVDGRLVACAYMYIYRCVYIHKPFVFVNMYAYIFTFNRSIPRKTVYIHTYTYIHIRLYTRLQVVVAGLLDGPHAYQYIYTQVHMYIYTHKSRLIGCARYPSVEPEMSRPQEEAVCKFLQHGQTKGSLQDCCLDLTDGTQPRSAGT